MAIKRFCDACGDELTQGLVGNQRGGEPGVFSAELHNGLVVTVKATPGDWCDHCMIDAVKKHDTRPTYIPSFPRCDQ